MKQKIFKWALTLVVVLAAIGTIQTVRGRWIWPSQIKQVEFRGFTSCDAPSSKKIVLTEDETRQLLTYYSLATYVGTVCADGCPSDFGFQIYLSDGTVISCREAFSDKVAVNPPYGERYWIKSKKLTQYAMSLVEKYGLAVNKSNKAVDH